MLWTLLLDKGQGEERGSASSLLCVQIVYKCLSEWIDRLSIRAGHLDTENSPTTEPMPGFLVLVQVE